LRSRRVTILQQLTRSLARGLRDFLRAPLPIAVQRFRYFSLLVVRSLLPLLHHFVAARLFLLSHYA
jgi:hypothetical protein